MPLSVLVACGACLLDDGMFLIVLAAVLAAAATALVADRLLDAVAARAGGRAVGRGAKASSDDDARQ